VEPAVGSHMRPSNRQRPEHSCKKPMPEEKSDTSLGCCHTYSEQFEKLRRQRGFEGVPFVTTVQSLDELSLPAYGWRQRISL
jgi:hypothetical protein